MVWKMKDISRSLEPLLTVPQTDSSHFTGFQLAAVLIIIHYNYMLPYILLTKRSSNLRSHTSEISFPGGKYTNEDKSLCDTAIRETREEIGLDFKHKDIIGSLAMVRTLTSNYVIMPFVTLQRKIPKPKILVEEVEEVIDIPLMDVLWSMTPDTEHYHLSVREVYKFTYQNRVIWGATARILKQLHNCLCNSIK